MNIQLDFCILHFSFSFSRMGFGYSFTFKQWLTQLNPDRQTDVLLSQPYSYSYWFDIGQTLFLAGHGTPGKFVGIHFVSCGTYLFITVVIVIVRWICWTQCWLVVVDYPHYYVSYTQFEPSWTLLTPVSPKTQTIHYLRRFPTNPTQFPFI